MPVLHFFLEVLEIWFEAIVSGLGIYTPHTEGLQDDQDNTYAIRARKKGALHLCRANQITLTSQHLDLPLPNLTFLAIHAACCRIAALSGATEYLNKTLHGKEEVVMLGSWLRAAHLHRSHTSLPFEPIAKK
jgi:hypothetical protein